MDDAIQNVSVWFAVFAALGLSAERAVELIKNRIKWLDTPNPDDDKERTRKFWLKIITMVVATLIVVVTQDQLQDLLPFLKGKTGLALWWNSFLVGLLASAGSDFWNQSLGTLTKIKGLKRLELSEARKLAQAGGSSPAPPAAA
jgi:hypothetical protein